MQAEGPVMAGHQCGHLKKLVKENKSKIFPGGLGESRVPGSAVQLLNLDLLDVEMMNLCPVQS